MNFSKSKINVTLGALTGLLVGLVFGAAFGSSDKGLESSGVAAGNISLLSRTRTDAVQKTEAQAAKDTMTFTVIDEQGETWKVTMTK